MNYLITIIITVLLLFFFASKMDALVASVSWLTDDRMLYILTGLATLCFIRDIIIIKKSLFGVRTEINDEALSESNNDDNTDMPIKTLRQTCNEIPELMLSLSKDFEKRKGHKPTYEELLEYIDKEAFHLLSNEELKLETQAIVEQARRKARQQMNRQ